MSLSLHFENPVLAEIKNILRGNVIDGTHKYGCIYIQEFGFTQLTLGWLNELNEPFGRIIFDDPPTELFCDFSTYSKENIYVGRNLPSLQPTRGTWCIYNEPKKNCDYTIISYSLSKSDISMLSS